MPRSGHNKKVANGLVVMSSAAVLAVYSAGYVRTRPAAERLAALTRRVSQHDVTPAGGRAAPLPPVVTHPDAAPLAEPAPKIAAAPMPRAIEAPAAPAPATPAPAVVSSPAPSPVTPAVEQPAAESAPASPAAVAPAPIAPAAPATPAWKDGKYIGWGGCRHGDIQATVVIEGGKIVSAAISECQTRYPCDIIDKLPPEVVKRQSPDVDRIGGATESADAFYSAVYFALQKAN